LQSIHLINITDDILGQYTLDLRNQLMAIRNNIPIPSRNNPFPMRECQDSINEIDNFIKKIESLRTIFQNLPIPFFNKKFKKITLEKIDKMCFVDNLNHINIKFSNYLIEINDNTIQDIKNIISERNLILKDYLI
jgi:hypothetical protein